MISAFFANGLWRSLAEWTLSPGFASLMYTMAGSIFLWALYLALFGSSRVPGQRWTRRRRLRQREPQEVARAADLGGMPTHKFAFRTEGLSETQAAHLLYLMTSACEGVVAEETAASFKSASNVDLKKLKDEYPGYTWEETPDKERRDLVE